MKKLFVIVSAIVSIFYISNAKAVEVSNEEYALLRKVFSERKIAMMSEEDAARYLSYDLANTKSNEKIYKVVENKNGYTYTEVDELPTATTYNSTQYETNYKIIRITSSKISGNSYLVTLDTQWQINPKVKSYDVNAIRVEDATVTDGTQYGEQYYYSSSLGRTNYVSYSPNGTNILKKTNGFGISMNLVDEGSNFETSIEATITATSSYAMAYGSYQHAVTGVTLAQSKNYNISHNGYGKVVNFSSSVTDYYDGMAGVSIELGYTA